MEQLMKRLWLLLDCLASECKKGEKNWTYDKETSIYKYTLSSCITEIAVGIKRNCLGSCDDYEIYLWAEKKEAIKRFRSSELDDDKLQILKNLYEVAENNQSSLDKIINKISEQLLK